MKINELTSNKWPKILTADQAADYAVNLHKDRGDDADEGDLVHRIYRFETYELKEIPLNEIDSEEWFYDSDVSKHYSELKTKFPPIIYDPIAKSIIDGTHRVNAALMKKQKTILAYVGKDVDPEWTEEPPEENIDEANLNIPKSVSRNVDTSLNSKVWDDERLGAISYNMKKAGWNLLGTGYFSSVFENPKKSYVIKINYKSDNAFKHYADFIKENKNRHFPKISDVKTIKIGNTNYHIYLIEKLYEAPRLIKSYIHFFMFCRGEFDKELERHPNNSSMIYVKRYFEKHKELERALKTVIKNKSRFFIDMNDENVMQRKDGTIVISDPYSGV